MKKSAVKPREYKYEDLNSLQYNTTVDVYGVVKFLKQPFKTRGRDHCMVVSIMDPSMNKDEKLKCLLFHADPEKLPSLEIGSIVRFHRLKINMFKNELQGQTGPGFSWVVFSNEKDASLDPLSSLSSNYTFTDEDRKKVQNLRDWSDSKDDVINQNKMVSLENIIPQMYFDTVCQIVATCYFKDDNCLVLRVWDGTVTIYQLRRFDFDEELCPACDEDLARKADGFSVDIALYDEHCENARNKYKPGDFVKLVNLHAAIYKTIDTRETDLPTLELVLHRGNSFGRGIFSADDKLLRDQLSAVGCHVNPTSNLQHKNALNAKLITDSQQPSTSHKNSNLSKDRAMNSVFDNRQISGADLLGKNKENETALNSADEQRVCGEDVQDYQQMEVDAAVTEKDSGGNRTDVIPSSGTRCMQQTATVIIGHPHVKITKIKDVLKTSAPYKFRIMGHIEGIFPTFENAADMVKLFCEQCHHLCSVPQSEEHLHNSIVHCPNCLYIKTVLKYIYLMRFKISDGTGCLIAVLSGKEAVTFLHDISPEDFLVSESLRREIQDEMENIYSVDKLMLECCIKSYTVGQTTKYQIFDTMLV